MRKKKKHTMATFRICGIDEMSEFTTSFIPGLREITRSGRSLRATDTEEKREAEGNIKLLIKHDPQPLKALVKEEFTEIEFGVAHWGKAAGEDFVKICRRFSEYSQTVREIGEDVPEI